MFYDLALPALGVDPSTSADAHAAAAVEDAASLSLERLATASALGYSVVAIEREVFGRLNAAEEAGLPPGSVVSREALASALSSSSSSRFPSDRIGRVPRRPALRISSSEPHGGGGSGNASGRSPSSSRPSPHPVTQLSRLTLTTGDPGDAASVLGNRIGKLGGGGAGTGAAAATAATAKDDADGDGALPSTSAPRSTPFPFSARRSYDVLAIRPLNNRVLAQAASSLDVDVIVLDFSGSGSGDGRQRSQPSPSAFSLARMPKPSSLRPALSRGIALEVRYSPAIASERERRALLAGLSSLATTLRGRGGGGGRGKKNAECLSPFVLSSGAPSAAQLRAPLDAAALAQVAGLSGAASVASVTRVPERVARDARKRRAGSTGECGFVGGREAIAAVAAVEKRKAGVGRKQQQWNQQQKRKHVPQQQGGALGKRKKKRR